MYLFLDKRQKLRYIINMKETIVMIHGFGSGGKTSSTCQMVREHFEKLGHKVITPSFNSAMLEFSVEELIRRIRLQLTKQDTELTFVGISLGGFFARYLSNNSVLLFNKPCNDLILLNPALDAPDRLMERIGTNRDYNTQQTFTIREDQVRTLWSYFIEKDKQELNVTLVVTKDDDIVPPDYALEIFKERGRIVTLEKGGHRFIGQGAKILAEIEGAINTIAG